MSHSILDKDRIDELSREVGPADLVEIVEMFLEESQPVIERIASGLEPTAFGKAIHFLRSGALNIGLTGLAGEAARVGVSGLNDPAGAAASLRRAVSATRATVLRLAARA